MKGPRNLKDVSEWVANWSQTLKEYQFRFPGAETAPAWLNHLVDRLNSTFDQSIVSVYSKLRPRAIAGTLTPDQAVAKVMEVAALVSPPVHTRPSHARGFAATLHDGHDESPAAKRARSPDTSTRSSKRLQLTSDSAADVCLICSKPGNTTVGCYGVKSKQLPGLGRAVTEGKMRHIARRCEEDSVVRQVVEEARENIAEFQD